MKHKGFTLLEFLFAMAIATVIIVIITTFAKDIITLNSSAQSSMTGVLESRKILSVVVSELRSATPSALGSYPVETASTSTITFFADMNADGIADRVRYFVDLETNRLKRGVEVAIGEPRTHDIETQTSSTLITNISNSTSTPLFDYYDSNYSGTSTSMSLPISVPSVRLIKITIVVDEDPNRFPEPSILSSQAVLRNLKDNL